MSCYKTDVIAGSLMWRGIAVSKLTQRKLRWTAPKSIPLRFSDQIYIYAVSL